MDQEKTALPIPVNERKVSESMTAFIVSGPKSNDDIVKRFNIFRRHSTYILPCADHCFLPFQRVYPVFHCFRQGEK